MMYNVSLPRHTVTDTKPLNLIQKNNTKTSITIKLSFSQENSTITHNHNLHETQNSTFC